MLRNESLKSLWNKYYDSRILERLDLLSEWEFVEVNSSQTIGNILKPLIIHLSPQEQERIFQDLDKILYFVNNLSLENQTYMVFNILPLLIYYFREKKIDALNYILLELEKLDNIQVDERNLSKVILELTNNCNLQCVMCGVGSKKYSDKRDMDYTLYINILDSLPKSVKMLRLNGLGESTYLKNFDRYMDPLKSLDLRYEIITNLSFNNNIILETMLDLEFDIYVSCDSPIAEELVRIRRGLNPSLFFQNLSGIKDCSGRDPMKNQFIFTLMEENFKTLPKMIELALKYNFGGLIVNVVRGVDKSFKNRMFDEILAVFDYTNELAEKNDIILKLPDQIGGNYFEGDFLSKTNKTRCLNVSNEVFIRYNGDVCPCNMMNPFIYGNIRSSSLSEVINGINARLFQNLLNSEIRHPYCKNCYYMN